MTGIDYGLGQTNINKETGIRYGVIPHHAIGQAWYDDSLADYGKPLCIYCDGELDPVETFQDLELEGDYYCANCDISFDAWDDIWTAEPFGYYYNEQGYHAYQDKDTDIFVQLSPYYTLCEYCSPCAPGAGYVLGEGTIKAYCFGHDWFESGKAPYKVYSVETGKEV